MSGTHSLVSNLEPSSAPRFSRIGDGRWECCECPLMGGEDAAMRHSVETGHAIWFVPAYNGASSVNFPTAEPAAAKPDLHAVSVQALGLKEPKES